MFRLTGFIIVLLAFSSIGLAQDSIPSGCPEISISGPAGIVRPGEDALFTLNVGNVNGNSKPKFRWSVTGGAIIKGEGERAISVRSDGKASITATVEVLGLPAGCPNTVSETMPYCEPPPTALKIGEVSTIDAKTIQEESDRVIAEMRDFRGDDQLYIMIGIQNGGKKKDAEQLEKLVVDALSGPSGLRIHHETRITMVRCGAENYPVEFWRVPLGAETPPCSDLPPRSGAAMTETQEKINCPVVTVAGPPGRMHTGEEIIFSANVELDADNLVFRWLTSGGKIVSGQGTPHIRVSTTLADNGTTLTAYLTVIGLPDSCTRIAEGVAIVQDGGHPIMLDEFGRMTAKGIRERLDAAASSFKEQPTWVYYFILYFPEKEFPKRIAAHEKLIRDHLIVKHKIPAKQLVVLFGGTRQTQSTQIYFFPSQTPAPIP